MENLFVGVDVGTSGVRAVAIDSAGVEHAQASTAMEAPVRQGAAVSQDAEIWWRAFNNTLKLLLVQLTPRSIKSIAIDGTSGTLLITDEHGNPLTQGLMYNDARAVEQVKRIGEIAPAESACHGGSSALAKLLYLQETPNARHALHQADWLAGRLCKRFGFSDDNNSLKTGYDVINREWPQWFDELDVKNYLLPQVLAPGSVIASIDGDIAKTFGLAEDVEIVAGTTDGCAAFLATGASEDGDAVTSLGSTLVVKVLSNKPLFAPEYGIYSHRLGDVWLPGGASNTGGAALQRFFDTKTIQNLSKRLTPETATGLDYYPLPSKGERFPVNNPALESKTEPRPNSDATFLQGLLEGIASVEKLAYTQMQKLGAPYPKTLRTVGGGASNHKWTTIRKRVLNAPMVSSISTEAAYGTALLARKASA